MEKAKCKGCGKRVDVSRDGWFVESYQSGKKEVKYTEWNHVVGHWNGKHLCGGSGASPREMRTQKGAYDLPVS